MRYQVIIPSARAANLIPCVRALLRSEPELSPADIIVVDDGARAEAEGHLPRLRWINGIKPFNFARNVNLAFSGAEGDVFLLNDDAVLLSPHGFSRLQARVGAEPRIGLCSAAIRGFVGNRNQNARSGQALRNESTVLAFVCVFVPHRTRTAIGPLDERFGGYGFEDNDYCHRVTRTGRKLAIWDGCIVDHSGHLPSTFRSRPDITGLFRQNQRLYEQKWKAMQSIQTAVVDLLFLTRNRLAFTMEAFSALVANTDWALVRTLYLWDDGSTDGTLEWMREQQHRVPAQTELVTTRLGSPVTAMVEWIRRARAPILAKIDNDTMVPMGWLRESLAVMDRHPELHFLGIEALYPAIEGSVERSYAPADWISGLGLYRRRAFERSLPTVYDKYFGLEEWQARQGPALVRGWMNPALPLFLLDRMPFDPWLSLSEHYITTGDQRPWQRYEPTCTLWNWRWPNAARDGCPPAMPIPEAPVPRLPARATGEPFVIGAMRVRNEGHHIAEVIERALGICARVVVLSDNSTDDTVAVCRSFGERVTVVESPFTGLDEARDKNFLLQKLLPLRPDWVLWIDGDEVLERRGPEMIRDAIMRSQFVVTYTLRIAYIWDDLNHVRVDGIFGRMVRASLFSLRGQNTESLHFATTGFGGNLHCGNVPRGLVGSTAALGVRLKHLGYLSRAERERKYAWYNSVDPNNAAEDNYRHLMEIGGARHAPGPVQVVPWEE
ncbi:MAG TPA: glycosyltransferase [Acetobacteraceae bacterium]|nr:glycosyltransferase [Acetobacteraceae bacterium]